MENLRRRQFGRCRPRPQRNATAINGLLPRFYGSIPRRLDQELYFGKLDYHLSDRNTFSASFNFLHAMSPNGIQTAASLTTGSAITGNGNDAVTVAQRAAGVDQRPDLELRQ